MPEVTEEQIKEITDALVTRRKIEAIKRYRAATGVGLKEAKAFIDDLNAKLRKTHPEAFANAPEGKLGCTSVLMLGMIVGGVMILAAEFIR
jgi:ribosomal protein L7/L12